tara:strand:+ start:189 stop:485 length:297 start_codon:yes stop_codon:yes gene_type:complete
LLHNIITVLLGVSTLFLGVVSFYALKRINTYEKIILKISTTVELIKHQLKIIDDKGHFEADDEVGFFFEEMKQLGNELEQLFETEVDDGNQEKTQKEK